MQLERHAAHQTVSCREGRHVLDSLKVKELPRHVCAKSQRRDAILKFGAAISSGLLFPDAAKAVRQIERSDGSLLDAFQFDIPLRVVSLAGSVPGDWEQEFKQVMRGRVQFKMERRAQLMDIYKELSRPQDKKSAATADIVSLGDAFLGPAIKNDLIQPISSFQDEAWWKLVNPRWQHLLRRDSRGVIDRNGQIYGVPFSWGATLIAYRNDKLTERLSSYCNLRTGFYKLIYSSLVDGHKKRVTQGSIPFPNIL